MCVGFWSLTHPEYALILCANRDEFLDRPTLPAHFHSFEALSQPANVSVSNEAVQPDHQGTAQAGSILSGRDVLAEGAWLGIHRTTGRVALLTNITELPREYASSRGTLVASFLGDPCGDLTSEAAALTRQTTPYAGFNLLLLEPLPSSSSSSSSSASTLAYDARLVTNDGGGGPIRSRTLTDSERACGGMSNGVDGHGGDLWPKVVQGRAELGKVLDEELEQLLSRGPTDERLVAGRLIELLTAHSPIPPPRERAELKNTILVPPFDARLANPDAPHAYYGTRLAQVILVRRNGHVTYIEHDVWLLNTTGAPMRADANNMRTFTFRMGADS